MGFVTWLWDSCFRFGFRMAERPILQGFCVYQHFVPFPLSKSNEMCILHISEVNIKFFLYTFNNLIFLWLEHPMWRVDIFGIHSGRKICRLWAKNAPEMYRDF